MDLNLYNLYIYITIIIRIIKSELIVIIIIIIEDPFIDINLNISSNPLTSF